jgi:hypothetical protein
MRLTCSSLVSLLCVLTCGACEVKVGNADWDASFGDWDWDDDDEPGDPWDTPQTRKDAGKAPADEDGGAPAQADAAMSGGKDAGTPASMIDADIIVPDSGSDEPAITVGMVAEFLARGSCGALEACMGEELLRESLRGVDCVEFRTQVYANRELYWLAKSVAYGRVTFRPDLLSACERDLLDSGCDVQSKRLPDSCREALEGKKRVDEDCAIDQECAGKAYCNKGLMESCPGTCASLQTSGLRCLASSECDDGLVCRGGTCAKSLVEGDSCSVRLGFGECAPGLVCQGPNANTLTCRKVTDVYSAKQGEACDTASKLCAPELVCQSQSATSVMGVCAKRVASGETCRPSQPGQCPTGYYCKDARTDVTTRAPAGTDGVCSSLPADGADCLAAVGCKPGQICSTVDNKCHPREAVGDSCVEDAQCYTGRCNSNGKCAAPIDCSP